MFLKARSRDLAKNLEGMKSFLNDKLLIVKRRRSDIISTVSANLKLIRGLKFISLCPLWSLWLNNNEK